MSFLDSIYEYIKSGAHRCGKLGLEIEHFVIDGSGRQIPFEVVSPLIEKVGSESGAEIIYIDGHPAGYYNGRYSVTLEPSCQFEISVNPYSSISEIEAVYREFSSLWEPLFAQRGYRMVTKGLLPLVEAGMDPYELPLSPKKRYQYMDAYFRTSGKYGRYMMRATASTQVSMDYRSEEDLVRKLRILQKISPILMIMMESKTEEDACLPGAAGRPHLLRTQIWDNLDPARTGFYPHSMERDFDCRKMAEAVYRMPLILLTQGGISTYVGEKSAADLEREKVISADGLSEEEIKSLVEHFLSMGFFHFRVKKFIEIRIADSVPLPKALGYAALLKGIVYSDRNLEILERELEEIDGTEKIQEAIFRIEEEGREAIIYRGRTAEQWIGRLVELAKESLPENEKAYTDCL